MNQGLRASDQNFFRRLWEAGTPWIQVVGFVVGIAFCCGVYSEQFQAYGKALNDHTLQLAEHEKRLSSNDIALAEIRQNVKDIRDVLIPPRR